MKVRKKHPKINFARQAGFIQSLISLSLLTLAGLCTIALASYSKADPQWLRMPTKQPVVNAAGLLGAWLADLSLAATGEFAFALPWILLWYTVRFCLQKRSRLRITAEIAGWLLLAAVLMGSAGLWRWPLKRTLPFGAAGYVGNAFGEWLRCWLGMGGGTLLLCSVGLVGVTLLWGHQLSQIRFAWPRWKKFRPIGGPQALPLKMHGGLDAPEPPWGEPNFFPVEPSWPHESAPLVELQEAVDLQESSENAPAELSEKTQPYSDEEILKLSRDLENQLADFGVIAQVVGVLPGPVVTRFEMTLAPGVKAGKVTSLARDLARGLAVVSVRIVEIIPGKSVIGIELPNRHRQIVQLAEILKSSAYRQSASALTIALGKDIAGQPVVVDLANMPHLLVAGTTGSGKSVAVNSMLLSLLYKSSPENVRLLLIDPKMLELSVYENIPHLLCPVIIDMKQAGQALLWCVGEMERRYELMSRVGVRHISSFNELITSDRSGQNAEIADGELMVCKLPFIVVVIDEFADLIMVVGKKVEELIARLAQKARAAGIHLILATQRPSVDVITGLIKANIPTRIAFQVASRIDSRTILDQQGAEQLLGKGDMLYLPIGAGVPTRVHGAYVTDQEVHEWVKAWQARGEPQYDPMLVQQTGAASVDSVSVSAAEAEADPLYDQAVSVVLESRRASISYVQRRLKIGYNRAARLIEGMEMAGLVSPVQSHGGRDLLVQSPLESAGDV